MISTEREGYLVGPTALGKLQDQRKTDYKTYIRKAPVTPLRTQYGTFEMIINRSQIDYSVNITM